MQRKPFPFSVDEFNDFFATSVQENSRIRDEGVPTGDSIILSLHEVSSHLTRLKRKSVDSDGITFCYPPRHYHKYSQQNIFPSCKMADVNPSPSSAISWTSFISDQSHCCPLFRKS